MKDLQFTTESLRLTAELAKAGKKPDPTEFTKKIRKILDDHNRYEYTHPVPEYRLWYDACDIVDRLTDENAKFIKALEGCSTCKDQYEAEVARLTDEKRIVDKRNNSEIARLKCAFKELEHNTDKLSETITELADGLKAKEERTAALEHWLQHAITILGAAGDLGAAGERPNEIAGDWKRFLKKALEQALKGGK